MSVDDRLRDRAQQIPPAVEEFLEKWTGPLTLDDMAFLARALSPWEVTRLQRYLPVEAIAFSEANGYVRTADRFGVYEAIDGAYFFDKLLPARDAEMPGRQ